MTVNQWLLRMPSKDATGRIFCFPYSGAGGSMFNRWPRWIGSVEVCPLQLPGRESRIREPHFGTYEQLADQVAEAIESLLDKPFALFGHCAGALPAYEVARRLTGRNLPPSRLVVSAQVAPHDCPHDRLLDCTDDELLTELTALFVRQGGEPHPALLDLALRVLREDLVASRDYGLPEPAAVAMGLTVMRWTEDPEVTEEELEGWRHYGPDVRFTALSGDHWDFLSPSDVLLSELAKLFDGGIRDDQ